MHTKIKIIFPNPNFRSILLGYHLIFAFFAYQVMSDKGGDAYGYWFVNVDIGKQTWSEFVRPGTDIIKLITYPLVKFGKFPFEIGFILFSLISSIAVIKLYDLIIEISTYSMISRLISHVLILLPGFHFWTSSIGKEAICIVPTTLLAIELFKKNKVTINAYIYIILIGLIRPHFAFIIIVAYTTSFLLIGGQSLLRKIYFSIGASAALLLFVILLFTTQDFNGGFDRIIKKIDTHISFFQKTSSYVPINEYSWPLKLFTFYFRPFLGEKMGLLYLVFSLENTVFLGIVLLSFYRFFTNFNNYIRNQFVIFSVLLSVIFALIFAGAYANYGIIARTKIMIYPFIYILLVYVISNYNNKLRITSSSSYSN